MDSYNFYNLHNLSNFMQDSQNIPSNQFNYDNQIQIENNNNLDNNGILNLTKNEKFIICFHKMFISMINLNYNNKHKDISYEQNLI